MADVWSMIPSSPLMAPSGNESHGRLCSSVASIGSHGTVQHHRLRSLSTSSLSSVGSLFIPAFSRYNGSTASGSRFSFNPTLSTIRPINYNRSASSTNSKRTSYTSALSMRHLSDTGSELDQQESTLQDVVEGEDEYTRRSIISDLTDQEYELEGDGSELQESHAIGSEDLTTSNTSIDSTEPRAFQRWVSKLRRRHQKKPARVTPRGQRWQLDDFDPRMPSPKLQYHPAHSKAESQSSSLRFVTAVKSATATLASASVATISRRTPKWRRGQERSSLLSGSDARPSVDSQRSVMDEAAKLRSRKRREKLEELIRSEESYVADLKALSNAYFTIVGNQRTTISFARSSAHKTIAEILHLHDEILGCLHRVVPFAEYDQSTAKSIGAMSKRNHIRWHSVDGGVPASTLPGRTKLATIRQGRRSLNISRSDEEDRSSLRCSPQIAEAVAHVFSNHIRRFSAYEEYGANYGLLQKDIEETQEAVTSWQDFDRAIEALSAHVNPVRSREANRKKAMTVKDLLIKPIQRIPRYELLFNDLAKLTPVCDDPASHVRIEEVRLQLKQACQRINEAKENPSKSHMLETTWRIGNRLTFSSQVPRTVFLQLFGQVQLCGCLYIVYRGKDRIKGFYAICVLFETTLLLAAADEEQQRYSTFAGIALANATIEETDNAKGLQCHTAPHAWKVVFEHSARMYELIFVACSAVEADVWRNHTHTGIESQIQSVAKGAANTLELQSPLTNEMRSIGKAFGKPGSFVRRMSVHRTATVGPTTDLNQVIIKNTQAVKEAQASSSQQSLQIPRSQSVATPSHVQTLAPRRTERHRLETFLADVWTKELLPYPGMVRRSDPIRASANHVIRKFSMASITSNFSSSKRTASYTSVCSRRKEDIPPSLPPSSKAFGSKNGRATLTKTPRPPLIDFHTAPEAFLPSDFELQDPATTKSKKSALRALTMTMERPFSPLLGNENKPSKLRRAQSVRNRAVSPMPPPPLPPPARPASPPAAAVYAAEGGSSMLQPPPIYSIVRDRACTPASSLCEFHDDTDATGGARVSAGGMSSKTPKKTKSKSRLLRLFGYE